MHGNYMLVRLCIVKRGVVSHSHNTGRRQEVSEYKLVLLTGLLNERADKETK